VLLSFVNQVGAEIPMDSEDADDANRNDNGRTLLYVFERGYVHIQYLSQSLSFTVEQFEKTSGSKELLVEILLGMILGGDYSGSINRGKHAGLRSKSLTSNKQFLIFTHG
jgi:hypothetical protein